MTHRRPQRACHIRLVQMAASKPQRAPDSLLLTSAQPGLEPPNPLARVWRLQPWLGLAQQGHLHMDLVTGRGVPRLPRQQGAILQCRHSQPLAVHCHQPSSGHVSTSLGRLPSPVSSASSRSPAIVGIARKLADRRTERQTKFGNFRSSIQKILSGEIRLMLTNSLTAHKNFVKLGIWPYEAH